jgi:hypothetical protein
MTYFSHDSAGIMSLNTWLGLYQAKLAKKSEIIPSTGCVVWLGARGGSRGDYGLVRVKFPGCTRSRTIYVHRLQYMISTRQFTLPHTLQVSHLCHNGLCTKFEHLNLEPGYINNSRQSCKLRQPQTCLGHGLHPNCIFFY